MPIPKPAPTETKEEFIDRCISDSTMVAEYPENVRSAICYSKWDENKKPPKKN